MEKASNLVEFMHAQICIQTCMYVCRNSAENVAHKGPGSLRVHMIDKLHNMVEDGTDLEKSSRIVLLDKNSQGS